MSAEGKVVAAIDCGSNSTRLLIARHTADGYEPLERRMTITKMAEGVAQTGLISDAAMGRVVACLQDYRALMDVHHVSEVRSVGTSAARDAKNREDFFDLGEVVLGTRPELLTGEDEARLSFAGAVTELDPTLGPFLVVDIGGGSTEFVYGTDSVLGAISADMGCVRMSELYIEHDPARPEELVSAISIAELYLDDVKAAIPQASSATTLVGLAGTVAAAAAIEQGLAVYDRDAIHHFELTKEAVEDVFRTLATETADERLANPGMEPGRVDVIVGGLCILVKIMRQFDFDSCLVSEADILDGLIASLR